MSSYRVGQTLDDYCAACKVVRRHTVAAASGDGVPVRVVCDYCSSQHNYRGGGAPRSSGASASGSRSGGSTASATAGASAMPLVSERERSSPPMSLNDSTETKDIELLLRRVLRQELGLTSVTPADKWRGGELVLKPGRAGVQEKAWPIETFFHKVVMLRNRLRVLEQQINSLEIPADQKLKMQSYITGCYGSLTSFNVLFADEDDRFHGSGGD